MMLVDVNLLVYAVFLDSPHHNAAREWLDAALGGAEPVALPWIVLAGFIRISTNSRIMSVPLTLDQAIGYVDEWLALPVVRVLGPTQAHQRVFAQMLRATNATGNLVTDAQLAALSVEHGCSLVSADDDFQKFPGFIWVNPLAIGSR